MIGTKSLDAFTDVIPVALDADISELLRRHGYGLANHGGLYVEGGGTLVMKMGGRPNGATRTITVPDNSNVFGQILMVMTGSTATGIHVFVV